MKTISNEVKAKVFAPYLPCEIFYMDQQKVLITGVNESKLYQHLDIFIPFEISEAKLLLTPLKKISDEDLIRIAMIIAPGEGDDESIKWLLGEGKEEFIESFLKEDIDVDSEIPPIKFLQVYQYLQGAGYSLPHILLKGKDPITAGIALDKTLI